MELKTVTWNIGGGKHLKANEDPTLMASYSVDAIEQIAQWLKRESPDIITLQEVQGDDHANQVAEIARHMGYGNYFFDVTSDSFIDKDRLLGNGIISRFPIINHISGVFLNPNIEAVLQGRLIKTHDKGFSSCTVHIDGYDLVVVTLHLLPFLALGIELDSVLGQRLLDDIVVNIAPQSERTLIQGDFNIDSERIKDAIPTLFRGRVDEVPLKVPTTPAGKRFDHVIFRNLSLQSCSIDANVKTDHFPVTCIFRTDG